MESLLVAQTRREKEKGIVLRIEGDFIICVWSPNHPINELRFIDADQQHMPGDFISFKLTAPLDHLQAYDSITKIKVPRTVTVVNREPAPINILVQIGFPPRDSNYFDKDLIDTLDYGVIFYCYCPEFGKLASFDPLNFEPGHFYTACIERIPLQNDWSINKLGTMFTLVDQPLDLIENEDEIRRLNSLMPWNRLISSSQPQKEQQTSYGATVRALLDNSQININSTSKINNNKVHYEENLYTPKYWHTNTNNSNSINSSSVPRKNDFGDLEQPPYHYLEGIESSSSSNNLFSETKKNNSSLINSTINTNCNKEENVEKKKEFLNLENKSLMLPTIKVMEGNSNNFQSSSDFSTPSTINSPPSVINSSNNKGFELDVDKIVSEIVDTINLLKKRNMKIQAIEFEKNIFEMCCKLQKEMLKN